MTEPLILHHGRITRSKPVDLPPRIAGVIGCCGTDLMLMISEGFGSHSELLSGVELHAWLKANHPKENAEIHEKTADGEIVRLERLPTEIVKPLLEHLRAKKRDASPASALKSYELGCLSDDTSLRHRSGYNR